jgi:hypothetical protein
VRSDLFVVNRSSIGKEAMLENDELTGTIIGCAIEVHRHMGSGLMDQFMSDVCCMS